VGAKIGGLLVLARTRRCVEVEPEVPLVEGRMSGRFEVGGGAPLIVDSTILCVGGKGEDFVVFGII